MSTKVRGKERARERERWGETETATARGIAGREPAHAAENALCKWGLENLLCFSNARSRVVFSLHGKLNNIKSN